MSEDNPGTLHYCRQISLEEYENQRLTASQQALTTLLDEIINDASMAAKEKKKRLKQVRAWLLLLGLGFINPFYMGYALRRTHCMWEMR